MRRFEVNLGRVGVGIWYRDSLEMSAKALDEYSAALERRMNQTCTNPTCIHRTQCSSTV